MLNRDLARAWQCWQEMYNAKVYAKNRLREVGNHFRSPELAKAFDWWVKYHAVRSERTKLNEATKKIGLLGKTAEASVRMQEDFDVAFQQCWGLMSDKGLALQDVITELAKFVTQLEVKEPIQVACLAASLAEPLLKVLT